MWLQLSQILKKFTEGNARKSAFFLLRWRHKNQKNTRGTRVVIHLSTHSYDAMYCVREGKSKLEPFYRLFKELFCHNFFGPRLNHMLEQSFEVLPRVPKWFNAFQVLEWFSFLLRVNCVIFARAINTDVWQAMVARAIEPRKNSREPP